MITYNDLKEIYDDQVGFLDHDLFKKKPIYYSTSFQDNSTEKNKLNFKIFLNCLGLISQYMKFDIYSNSLQKFMFLFERIHQSEGLKNVIKKNSSVK